jgi:hypothetical protein
MRGNWLRHLPAEQQIRSTGGKHHLPLTNRKTWPPVRRPSFQLSPSRDAQRDELLVNDTVPTQPYLRCPIGSCEFFFRALGLSFRSQHLSSYLYADRGCIEVAEKSLGLVTLVVISLQTYLLPSVSKNSPKELPLSLRSSHPPLPLHAWRCARILRLP